MGDFGQLILGLSRKPSVPLVFGIKRDSLNGTAALSTHLQQFELFRTQHNGAASNTGNGEQGNGQSTK